MRAKLYLGGQLPKAQGSLAYEKPSELQLEARRAPPCSMSFTIGWYENGTLEVLSSYTGLAVRLVKPWGTISISQSKDVVAY